MAKHIVNEVELVQASVKGNNVAFEGLVAKYQSLVCAITYGATGDIGKSEELAQEIFVKAWKDLAQLRELTKFRAWLCSITRTTISNHRRREKRNVISNVAPLEAAGATSSDTPEPSHNLIAKEQLAVVAQALSQLPESYREPLILFYRQEQSVRQVAEQLELSEGNVRTRLSRGRKMLKEQVAAMVENTLSSTAPGKAFTVAVMASVAGIAIKGAGIAEAATQTTKGFSVVNTTSTSITAIMSGVTTKTITVAAAMLIVGVGSFFAIRHFHDRSPMIDQPGQPVPIKIEPTETFEVISSVEKTEEMSGAVIYRDGVEAPVITNAPGEAADASPEKIDDQPRATDQSIVMNLLVVDKDTSDPMAYVNVSTQRDGKYVTDVDGTCKVMISKDRLNHFIMHISKDGFVPIRYRYIQRDETPALPEDFTINLEKSTSIGGFIVNEQGKSIENASVYLLLPDYNNDIAVDIYERAFKSDSQGRWRCDLLPARINEVSVKLSHSGYICDETYGSTAKASVDQLRTMDAVFVMKKGLEIKGIVTNIEGEPIASAKVLKGKSYFGRTTKEVVTDANGSFKYTNSSPGEIVLTVRADGFAPDLKEVIVEEEMQTVEFELEPARTISGRIVDVDGKPIKRAFVGADKWRGYRSLKWRVSTNKNGYFVMKNAPNDEVIFDMGKDGYMSVRDYPMSASDQKYEIVMYKSFRIAGTVTDSITGEPVSEFKLMKSGQIETNSGLGKTRIGKPDTFYDGSFVARFDEPMVSYSVTIEANGYLPQASPLFVDEVDELRYDFKLEKSENISGTVFLADASPAKDAQVIKCDIGTMIENGRPKELRERLSFVTDGQGHFSVRPEAKNSLLIILHNEGYAEVTTDELISVSEITLQPWSKMVGQLFIAGNPGANEKIVFNSLIQRDNKLPSASCSSYAITDEQGFFMMDRIVPGKGRLKHQFELGKRGEITLIGYNGGKLYKIASGETVTVILGEPGVAIEGSVVIEPLMDQTGFTTCRGNLKTKRPKRTEIDKDFFHDIVYPEDFHEMPQKDKVAWIQEWLKSKGVDTGSSTNDQYQDSYRSYDFAIDKDGRFHIDDIAAGNYILQLNVYNPPRHPHDHAGKSIGQASLEIEIPSIETAGTDFVIDIGQLVLKIQNDIKKEK